MPALQLPRMPVASDSACIKISDCSVRAAHLVTVPCYTSFLASTNALPLISIKDTIVFDQYVGLGPSSGCAKSPTISQHKVYYIRGMSVFVIS